MISAVAFSALLGCLGSMAAETSAPEPNASSASHLHDLDTAASASKSDANLAREEFAVKRLELQVRQQEAEKAARDAVAPWWRRGDPLLVAVEVAILTLLGNMVVLLFNSRATVNQEAQKAKSALELEQLKAKYTLVLQAIATNDSKAAERNINFFIEAGLLDDAQGKIKGALDRFKPVLPAPSRAAPEELVAANKLALLYNFPAGVDGTGQVVGILEFGGGYKPAELDVHFAKMPGGRPSVTDVSINGVRNSPGSGTIDAQVLTDIQIVGGIAPRASLRVYFADFSADGWVKAIRRASSDGVSVLLVGWGQPERDMQVKDVKAIDAAVEQAAKSGMTIVAAAGDESVNDKGSPSKRAGAIFPASSQWVLAVGGTSLKQASGRIISETPDFRRTGDVSQYFERPAWQSNVAVPERDDGGHGRGIPDVAAMARTTWLTVDLGTTTTGIGGSTVSAGIWAGLIALVNQGLGRNVGYLNPRLYTEIGPAGVLRKVRFRTHRDSVADNAPSNGWNADAGWGAPDGERLLEWLRAHQ
jgi:hypothetical protein